MINLEYWYVFPAAIFTCIAATSSGFSGAVLFQPFFFFVLKLPVASSIATGIATETIGMTGGAIGYARMGYHDIKIWKKLLPWALTGVVIGFFFFIGLPPELLKGMVGISMILVSLTQFVSLTGKLSGFKSSTPIQRWGPIALLAGAFSSSTGTGVAELSQPIIEHAGKVPTKRANATAILLEASADWLITLLNLKLGHIRYDILIFSVSGVLIGSQIGPRISGHLPDKLIKIVFSICVGLIGVFYIWNSMKMLLAR